jgi:hypothetical protein
MKEVRLTGDLISREWLEDAFDNLCCHDCKICRNFRIEDSFYKCALIDNAPTVPLPDFKEGYKQAIIDGKTNYSRPQDEWIPVSERLPEIATTCLVQLSNGYITMGKYHSIRGGSWVFIDTTIQFVYPKDSVIAWRPLPEPYKEDNAK